MVTYELEQNKRKDVEGYDHPGSEWKWHIKEDVY